MIFILSLTFLLSSATLVEKRSLPRSELGWRNKSFGSCMAKDDDDDGDVDATDVTDDKV